MTPLGSYNLTGKSNQSTTHPLCRPTWKCKRSAHNCIITNAGDSCEISGDDTSFGLSMFCTGTPSKNPNEYTFK